MKVTLIDSTQSPEQRMGEYAAICYNSGKTDEQSNLKRAIHCMDSGHLSVMRFINFTFLVEDISKVALAQLTRSAHLSYLVRSSRYCDEGETSMYRPDSFESLSEDLKDKWIKHENDSKYLYNELRNEGQLKKQDARYLLPQSQLTSLYVTGNGQAWKSFLSLRTGKSVQEEVKQVALEIEKLLHDIAPNIF
jgi:thymidylate synthase (FAD)